MDDPRARVAELAELLEQELGADLIGLYLFGSLAAGGFIDGRSDVDLLAVVERDIDLGQLAQLEELHTGFAAKHPAWIERVEVGYLSRAVLQTLARAPKGGIGAVSPGEPLNIKEIGWDWVINWHGVCTRGEVVRGPRPLELGPEISPEVFRRAVKAQLDAWPEYARHPSVAYVPAQQGYIVVTVCRALHALETGEQATKEEAAAWAARRFPERTDFIREALAAHRADFGAAHARVIEFVEFVTEKAG
jgi:hypothetical protein